MRTKKEGGVTLGSRDSSVVRVLDLRLKGHRFESQQGQQGNVLLQGQHSLQTLILVSVTMVACK